MIIGRVSKKGQIVIPKEIRKILGIKSGDAVIFRIEDKRIIIEISKDRMKDILKAGRPIGQSIEFQRALREEWI